jgi:hypothetical protein
MGSIWDDIGKYITASIIGLVVLLYLILIVSQSIQLILQPNVSVSVDGKIVFQGNNACIEESSLGSSTHLQINRGPLCLFPGPKYTSNKIETKPLQ